jgi:hypothetical protein
MRVIIAGSKVAEKPVDGALVSGPAVSVAVNMMRIVINERKTHREYGQPQTPSLCTFFGMLPSGLLQPTASWRRSVGFDRSAMASLN